MRSASSWAALAIALCTSAHAEVRLLSSNPSHASVRVVAKAGSVWEPHGAIDAATLNPLGSLAGDLAPTISTHDASVLAVWGRPSTGQLVIAFGREAWAVSTALDGADTTVIPQATWFHDGWVVSYRESSTGRTKLAHVAPDGSLGATLVLASGTIEALAATGAVLNVIVRTGDGSTVVFAVIVPDETPTIFRVVRMTPLVATIAAPELPPSRLVASRVIRLPHDAPLVFKGGDRTTLLDPQWQGAQPSNTRSIALGGSLVGVVQLSETEAVALWWRDSSTLEFVKLSDSEIGDVQQVSGRGNFSPSLVKEALRVATAE